METSLQKMVIFPSSGIGMCWGGVGWGQQDPFQEAGQQVGGPWIHPGFRAHVLSVLCVPTWECADTDVPLLGWGSQAPGLKDGLGSLTGTSM